jgi:hypothetical protein
MMLGVVDLQPALSINPASTRFERVVITGSPSRSISDKEYDDGSWKKSEVALAMTLHTHDKGYMNAQMCL